MDSVLELDKIFEEEYALDNAKYIFKGKVSSIHPKDLLKYANEHFDYHHLAEITQEFEEYINSIKITFSFYSGFDLIKNIFLNSNRTKCLYTTYYIRP